jgi:predicted nucleotidyltransferase
VEAIRELLNRDPRIDYALLFGSAARQSSRRDSDVDIAVGLVKGLSLSPVEVGTLVADLEHASGRAIDLTFLHEAPPALAYRIFRDGVILIEHDHRALAERKARSILDYLDFRPVEDIVIRGVLAAAVRGR